MNPEEIQGKCCLGIDQAIECFGVNVIDIETQRSVYSNVFKTPYLGMDRFITLRKQFTTLVQTVKPVLIAREGIAFDYQYGRIVDMAMIAGMVDDWASLLGYVESKANYYLIPPATWKKICLGRGDVFKTLKDKTRPNNYLEIIKQITGMEFSATHLADSYFIAKCACLLHQLRNHQVKPWDLGQIILEAVIDRDYCSRTRTGKETVAKAIIKRKDWALFDAYYTFNAPSWAERFPVTTEIKFSPCVIATNKEQIRNLRKQRDRNMREKRKEKGIEALQEIDGEKARKLVL